MQIIVVHYYYLLLDDLKSAYTGNQTCHPGAPFYAPGSLSGDQGAPFCALGAPIYAPGSPFYAPGSLSILFD